MNLNVFRHSVNAFAAAKAKRSAIAAFTLLLPTLAATHAHAQSYSNLYDLETLGGNNAQAYSIASGRIVGTSDTNGGSQRGAVWSYSTSAPYAPNPLLKWTLPPIPGFTTSAAYAINANLQRIAGSSSNGTNTYATGWALDNTAYYPGTVPYRAFNIHPTNGYDNSVARTVSSFAYTTYDAVTHLPFGTWYGRLYGGTYSSTTPAVQPFGSSWLTPPNTSVNYYLSSSMIGPASADLGRLTYADFNGAAGESYVDPDTLVGAMWDTPGVPRAFCRYFGQMWSNPMHNGVTPYVQWETLAGNVNSEATCILPSSTATGLKTVAGWTTVSGNIRGFLWTKTGGLINSLNIPGPGSTPVLTILPTLGGTTIPYSIRKSSGGSTTMIVGKSEVSGVPHAFAYYGGTIRDLNSILPAGSGWILKEARGCFEATAGTWLIVGNGDHVVNGVTRQRGFLLVITGVPN